MSKLREIASKFLPWEVNATQRLVEHAKAGTVPDKPEIKTFGEQRATRILVGTAVAGAAGLATLCGVQGFGEGGVKGAVITDARSGISALVDGNIGGVADAAASAARTIGNAAVYAKDHPEEIPGYVLQQSTEDIEDSARNLVTTVALIETGKGLAGAYRRAQYTKGLNDSAVQTTTSAPPFPEEGKGLARKIGQELTTQFGPINSSPDTRKTTTAPVVNNPALAGAVRG